MKITEAKRKDITSIIKLSTDLADFHRKLDEYYKPGKERREDLKKYILRNFGRKNFKILVVKDKNKIVGYFASHIQKPSSHITPKRIGRISYAFILEKYRKKGIGQQLFEELIKWFKANKIKNVELFIDSRNKIGLIAWKKYGFFEFQKKMRLDL